MKKLCIILSLLTLISINSFSQILKGSGVKVTTSVQLGDSLVTVFYQDTLINPTAARLIAKSVKSDSSVVSDTAIFALNAAAGDSVFVTITADTVKTTVIEGDNLFLNLGSTSKSGAFDKGVTTPTATTRANYNGYLYATSLIGNVNNGVGVSGTSSTSNGVVGVSNSGSAGNFTQIGSINSILPVLSLNRTKSGLSSASGSMILITDSPTTTGLVSGGVLSAIIDGTERIKLNPRSSRTNTAYFLDTDSSLTTGKLFSLRNQGSEVFSVNPNGYINIDDGSFNVVSGYDNYSITSFGLNNVIYAISSMNSNVSGSDNISIGQYPLFSNTDGELNIAIGEQTLYSNTTGGNNLGMGLYSLYNNTTGAYNVGIGNTTLNSLTTGTNNIGLGVFAGAYIGSNFSNRLFINSLNRSNLLGDTTKSIIYGYQDADVANQNLYLNANTYISEGLSINNGDVLPTTDSVDAYVAIQNHDFDSLTANKYKLSTSTLTYSEGSLNYDNGTKSLTFYNDITGFTHNLGYENVRRVYNGTGSTIPDGRAVRKVGTYVDGDLIASIALAGCSSYDSLPVYGITTTSIAPGGYGIVTVSGNVRELDLSGLNDTLSFLGYAGAIVDTCPSPPLICQPIGEIIYADNDSGLLDVRLKEPTYFPSPHYAADTSNITSVVSVASANVWYKIPIGTTAIRDIHGFTKVADSLRCDVAGHYTFVLTGSFGGNPATENWDYGFFINNVFQFSKSRTTSSSNTGDVSVPMSREIDAGDWISCRIRNTSGTGDPTFQDLGIQLLFLHR